MRPKQDLSSSLPSSPMASYSRTPDIGQLLRLDLNDSGGEDPFKALTPVVLALSKIGPLFRRGNVSHVAELGRAMLSEHDHVLVRPHLLPPLTVTDLFSFCVGRSR